jgi:hypothetical protein
METDKQGFTNHETELATQWIDNTPDEYEYWTERTEEILRGYPSKGKTTSQGFTNYPLTVKCLTEEEKGKPQGHKQKGYWILRSDILNAVGKLADELKKENHASIDEVDRLMRESDRDLFAQLLAAAIARVDWYQIARGLVESAAFNNTFPLEEHITTQE